MTATMNSIQDYVTNWVDRPGDPDWITALRKKGFERFSETGFPTLRHEDWRWTNLSGLTKGAIGSAAKSATPAEADIRPLLLEGVEGDVLVFVDGVFSTKLSRIGRHADGILVRDLAGALGNGETALEGHVGGVATHEDRPFLALNTAFLSDGTFVHVPDGKAIETPVQIVYVTTAHDSGIATHPRNVFVVGADSRATIVESYLSLGGSADFTNPVTEIRCGARSTLRHYRMQRENLETHHIATTALQQADGSHYHGTYVNLGGILSRHEVLATLDGEHIECVLDALSIGGGRQVLDNHSRMEHAKPNCHSHQIFKGIFDGHSRGVFDGKIHVWRDAQKTDAVQTSRNLLLSDDAISNNKPQLEIYADDVKCTHGATTGQIDDSQVFYLRSRGLDEDAARSLLTYAFACEITERIDLAPFEKTVKHELLTRLPMGGLIKGAV